MNHGSHLLFLEQALRLLSLWLVCSVAGSGYTESNNDKYEDKSGYDKKYTTIHLPAVACFAWIKARNMKGSIIVLFQEESEQIKQGIS